MLRKLRAFLKSYRAAGGASPLVVLLLLLCAAMLMLTALFSGSGSISDTLFSSIPLEFSFERIHYFEDYYDPYTNNDLLRPEDSNFSGIGPAFRFNFVNSFFEKKRTANTTLVVGAGTGEQCRCSLYMR